MFTFLCFLNVVLCTVECDAAPKGATGAENTHDRSEHSEAAGGTETDS